MVQSAEVIPINIEDEMRGSYLDYAMSVIIGRAIPDVRDGLKPVHRRILYAMYREGMLSNKRFTKCAGVVGEVLKKYHPHGDMAVYDSLVRMAQHWNMRYPLIEGQGNFGCFTGDTKIRVADGRTRSFVELINDAKEGKTHFTYTIGHDGSIAMAPIRAPRLTKMKATIVAVTLDNNEIIRCTPDHRFMLRDGRYREAHALQSGDSLMPLYSRLNEGDDPDMRGYEEVYHPSGEQWQFAHRLADAYNVEHGVYPRSAASKALWEDADYRAFHSRRSARQWQDPDYRASHEQHLVANGQKTTKSRFLSICQRALERAGVINELSYEWERKAAKIKGLLQYRQGLQRYYHGDVKSLKADSVAHHGRLNHTVVSVEDAGRADVYDLTIDLTHNFALAAGVFVHNSVDGDSAAAYRYTECRLTKLAEELLADIDKETVDFGPNFDTSTLEPLVLPSKVPNLILNGSDGIAVGMATKIPPHNLCEVVDALLALITDPTLVVKDLMKCIPGPDFPTGAFIHGKQGIREAYEKGRGIIRMRARAMIEPIAKGDREQIVVNEIPFQVNKARLITRIAELVQEGKMVGISDIRDESDRDGMRIVIELKRGTVAGVVLNQLYKHTAMQSTFGVIMLSIVNQQPKVLNLKEMLTQFIDHRREVVVRRTAYELREAEKRAHILAGLKIAVENIDAVIALIKKAQSPDVAREGLVKQFKLSEIQAQAVLEMRLQRLTGLEREKIIAEYDAIMILITELKAILADERLVFDIIKEELMDLKTRFGDDRRTEIQAETEEMSLEDLIQEEDMVVTVSYNGYIKRNPISIYRAQRRGGHGKKGMSTGDEDFVRNVFVASTHSYLLIFSGQGKVYWLKVHEVPQIGRTAKGKAISNLIQLPSDDYVAAILPVREFAEGDFVVTATAHGYIKKTSLAEYSRPRAGGIIAATIEEGDRIIGVRMTNGKQHILLSTRLGQAIRFQESDVRPMGRASRGVIGIRLATKDRVVSMETLQEKAMILSVTANGYGKRTALEDYRVQGRGGSGIITIKTTERNGLVVSALQVSETDHVMMISTKGTIIRTPVKDISEQGRNTQGVRLISVSKGEEVSSVAKLAEAEEG